MSTSWWKIAFAQLLLLPWITSAVTEDPNTGATILDPDTDFTLWIDPRCSDGMAEAFNEVRTVASELRNTLLSNNVPKWLEDAMNRWFGFGTDSPHFEKVETVLQRIGGLHRVNEFNLARYAMYCDNQEGAGWSKTDETTWFHEPSAYVGTVSGLACQRGAAAGTWNNFPEVWQRRLDRIPSVNGHQTSIFMCSPALNLETFTLRQLAEEDLELKHVLMEYSLFRLVFHELCHVHELSYLGLDFGQSVNNPQWGRDYHHVYEGGVLRETRNGYYNRRVGDHGNVPTCAKSLGLPEFTLYNPDSYALFAQEYRMHLLTWETVEDRNGNLWYQRWTKSETDIPEVKNWPTNQAPDWTDKATPREFLPDSLKGGAGRVANRDVGNDTDASSETVHSRRVRRAHANHHGSLGSHGHAHLHKL